MLAAFCYILQSNPIQSNLIYKAPLKQQSWPKVLCSQTYIYIQTENRDRKDVQTQA